MIYNIDELKKITNKTNKIKFHIKRILLFFILYVAINHEIGIFLNSGNSSDLSYIFALKLFSVLIISGIYSIIEYHFLKNIIVLKKYENTISINFCLFLLMILILCSFNLSFYPNFQNYSTLYTYSMIIIVSISLNIRRYENIKKIFSDI